MRDHVEGDALKGRVTRAILACDADLFLQALLSDVPHLYLFDPFAPCYGSTTIFSVDRWRRNLADDNSSSTGRRMAFDFVLFALMSGSDYAPAHDMLICALSMGNLRLVEYLIEKGP